MGKTHTTRLFAGDTLEGAQLRALANDSFRGATGQDITVEPGVKADGRFFLVNPERVLEEFLAASEGQNPTI